METMDELLRSLVGKFALRLLPSEELQVVQSLPLEERQDRFIAASYDPEVDALNLVRGDFRRLTVPMSAFPPAPTATPDPTDLGVIDYGGAIRMGVYEASTDCILYEYDREYRKRIDAHRRQEDRGFGPALRRLRIQRGVAREDFPGLSAKTIARLERTETQKPRGRTLQILAKILRVDPDEIETF